MFKTSKPSERLIAAVIFVFLILTVYGLIGIVNDERCSSCTVYNAIGFGIIMLWSCIFISYFIWASYFYNINYGITDKEWDKIDEAKKNRSSRAFYEQADIEDEPLYNPYSDQTFGLPPGTVRGMIAFTLLFGAVSLLVVSFGMKGEIEPGSFFRDQFEFFKTAFLMMIAFYFGSTSLKYLKGKDSISQMNTRSSLQPRQEVSNEPSNRNQQRSQVIVVDSSNPEGHTNPVEGSISPIIAVDPMAASFVKSSNKPTE